MKKIKIFILLIALLSLPSFVKAKEYFSCDNMDLIKLQKYASNVLSSYDYNEVFTPNVKYATTYRALTEYFAQFKK